MSAVRQDDDLDEHSLNGSLDHRIADFGGERSRAFSTSSVSHSLFTSPPHREDNAHCRLSGQCQGSERDCPRRGGQNHGVPRGPRNSEDNFVAVYLIELLFE